MKSAIRFFFVALGSLFALPLAGQQADAAVAAKHRSNCRLAAQVLETGHPHPHRAWALRYIGECEAEGAIVLSRLWQTVAGGAEVEPLVWSSLRLRDARLYQRLRETATDRSRPAPMRIAAMLVLARYTDPENAIWLTDLLPPATVERIPLVGASSTGYNAVNGDVRLTQPIAPAILALLDGIAAARGTDDRTVWYAAAVLAKRVRWDMEAGLTH